ncbi:hypothetical protein WICMUC_001506 [Wickerhamomyces mucosus]|uniref:Uncharacterized protein n=1 Tax=Wickerhamomyces mucosus TaxID=1378264 RepID=A0A9P8PW64_9ASCO|nr:hypothetical protein WICMUC_001506 [Wickerhamomyces mucosus]
MAKSPLIVPGADCNGLVAPKMALPCLTTSLPSQTVAKIGPDNMYDNNDGKNGFDSAALLDAEEDDDFEVVVLELWDEEEEEIEDDVDDPLEVFCDDILDDSALVVILELISSLLVKLV